MNHDSPILIHPTSNPAEDGHTIAPINPWKFHCDWSSHLWVYKPFATGFAIFWAPDNHAPVGAWLILEDFPIPSYLSMKLTPLQS